MIALLIDLDGVLYEADEPVPGAALVRIGKFRPQDLEGDICPEFVPDSFADLPGCWAEIVSTQN